MDLRSGLLLSKGKLIVSIKLDCCSNIWLLTSIWLYCIHFGRTNYRLYQSKIFNNIFWIYFFIYFYRMELTIRKKTPSMLTTRISRLIFKFLTKKLKNSKSLKNMLPTHMLKRTTCTPLKSRMYLKSTERTNPKDLNHLSSCPIVNYSGTVPGKIIYTHWRQFFMLLNQS